MAQEWFKVIAGTLRQALCQFISSILTLMKIASFDTRGRLRHPWQISHRLAPKR